MNGRDQTAGATGRSVRSITDVMQTFPTTKAPDDHGAAPIAKAVAADPTGEPPETGQPGALPPVRARHRAGVVGLALGAVGVVFGDIGTSPLYAMQTVFSIDDGAVKATPDDVYGVISLVFWSITLIVSIKYVDYILRADNDGEGGIVALAALIRERLGSRSRRVAVAMILGAIGASEVQGRPDDDGLYIGGDAQLCLARQPQIRLVRELSFQGPVSCGIVPASSTRTRTLVIGRPDRAGEFWGVPQT